MAAPDKPSPPDGSSPRTLLRRVDQAAIAMIVGVSWLLIAYWGLLHLSPVNGVIDIQEEPPLPLRFQVDINTADWVELSLLPNIGPVLAERIVESRETQGPFADHEDLRRVPGIGPKTLESIRRYLRPIPGVVEVADR